MLVLVALAWWSSLAVAVTAAAVGPPEGASCDARRLGRAAAAGDRPTPQRRAGRDIVESSKSVTQ